MTHFTDTRWPPSCFRNSILYDRFQQFWAKNMRAQKHVVLVSVKCGILFGSKLTILSILSHFFGFWKSWKMTFELFSQPVPKLFRFGKKCCDTGFYVRQPVVDFLALFQAMLRIAFSPGFQIRWKFLKTPLPPDFSSFLRKIYKIFRMLAYSIFSIWETSDLNSEIFKN